MELNWLEVDRIIEGALQEDIGTGDVTTNSIIPAEAVTKGFIHAKEAGVVCGMAVAERVFQILDPRVKGTIRKEEGAKVQAGDILMEVEGPARSILMGERLALNLMQRMSGIATRTARLAGLIAGSKAQVADTRKTTPGLRILEKYAVRMGGGKNHRFGLYDGVLIKDNHIKVAGGIMEAVALARKGAPHTLKIEVEVESLEGVREALEAKADIILLDNMDLETLGRAVELVGGQALTEASGGVSEETIADIAKTGVDLISVGGLTHTVKSLDISLDLLSIKGA